MDKEKNLKLFKYTTESKGLECAEVKEIISLQETDKTRLTLNAHLVWKQKAPKECLKITIIYDRPQHPIENLPIISDMRTIRKGEWLSCELNSHATFELFEALCRLYHLAREKGVKYGKKEYLILELTESKIFDIKKQDLSLLLSKFKNSPNIIDELVSIDTDIFQHINDLKTIQKKHKKLEQFKNMLDEKHGESQWQKFFHKNPWALGLGTPKIQFLDEVAKEGSVSSSNIHRKNEGIADFILASLGNVRFISIVEIKTPQTELLSKDKYRNAYRISSDLNGGLVQLRCYMRKWEVEQSGLRQNIELLEKNLIYTIQPLGCLIIGNSKQLDSYIKKESFDLFRRNQRDIEIITFDELYERSNYILNHEINKNK